MTEEQIVKIFKRKRPYGLINILKHCRLPLKFVGEGAFRDVYRITGHPLIVKIPKDADGDERDHALTEVRVYRKVMRFKKYEAIRQYMPTVLYYRDGITLVREYQTLCLSTGERQALARKICTVLDIPDWDWNVDNFGKDTNGNIVLLDLGCLTPDYANSAEELS